MFLPSLSIPSQAVGQAVLRFQYQRFQYRPLLSPFTPIANSNHTHTTPSPVPDNNSQFHISPHPHLSPSRPGSGHRGPSQTNHQSAGASCSDPAAFWCEPPMKRKNAIRKMQFACMTYYVRRQLYLYILFLSLIHI